MSHVVVLPIVFKLFYDRYGQGEKFKVVKNDSFLESHETIRVLHIVACPMDFYLLHDLGQQLGVLKMLLF